MAGLLLVRPPGRSMSEQTAKPYLIRAIYEWCSDSGLTPYLAVKVDAQTKVPLLGDIPVLGALFKEQSKTNNKDELLIFVTPKIVREGVNVY